MNSNTFIASIVLGALGAAPVIAQAGDGAAGQSAAKTRVEVRAELARASAAGELADAGEAWGTVAARSTRSRAEVLAELDAARTRGLLDGAAEEYASFRPDMVFSTRSRADVIAEAGSGTSRGNHTAYPGG